jgi:hypothetical protein
MMFLFVILICAVVFYFARMVGGGRHQWGPSSHERADPTYSALQILNERFARGEVQKQEYEEKKGAILSGARGRAYAYTATRSKRLKHPLRSCYLCRYLFDCWPNLNGI